MVALLTELNDFVTKSVIHFNMLLLFFYYFGYLEKAARQRNLKIDDAVHRVNIVFCYCCRLGHLSMRRN